MKKGFTLAETIGVIIILGLIAIIIVPFIDDYIKDSKEKALASNLNKIKEAAINWNAKYGSSYGCDSVEGCCITLDELKESEFLSDEDIIDPKTKSKISYLIAISKNNNSYEYNFVDNCSF